MAAYIAAYTPLALRSPRCARSLSAVPHTFSSLSSRRPSSQRAAIAAGADGLIIEAHNDPKNALCDGAQSLDLPQFDAVMQDIRRRAAFEGREMMPQ